MDSEQFTELMDGLRHLTAAIWGQAEALRENTEALLLENAEKDEDASIDG